MDPLTERPNPAAAPRPAALTVAASDPSGGAGLQADLRAFAAYGVEGAAAVTAVTVQDSVAVRAVHPVAPEVVAAQARVVLDDLEIRAAKTGVLPSAACIEALAEELDGRGLALVVDPVIVSTSGHAFLEPDAVAVLARVLLPLATLVTPNAPELAALLGHAGEPDADWSRVDIEGAAADLAERAGVGVLVTGGHGPDRGALAADYLLVDGKGRWLEGPWVATRHARGTGCVLSASIAAGLARGWSLREAVATAKLHLAESLRAAAPAGHGRGHPAQLRGLRSVDRLGPHRG